MICETCIYYDPDDRKCYQHIFTGVKFCSGYETLDPDYGSRWEPIKK